MFLYNSEVCNGKIRFRRVQDSLCQESADLYKSLQLSRDQCIQVCLDSIDQASSPAWHQHRKMRLTASAAHRILRARTNKTRVSYFHSSPPSGLHSLQWGRDLEPLARQKYESVTGNVVHSCGLVVSQNQPFLASSPDGIVQPPPSSSSSSCQPHLLEIKCPSRAINPQ